MQEEKKEAKEKEVKKEEKPAVAAAPAAPEAQAAAPAEAAKQKGPAFQPKSTAKVQPVECAGCGKSLRNRLFYFRNGAYYCTSKCFTRKKKGLVSPDASKKGK